MAIYPKLNPAPQNHLRSTDVANIEAWTEQAAQALHAMSLSAEPVTQRTSMSLDISLDGGAAIQAPNECGVLASHTVTRAITAAPQFSSEYRRREPLRRDSLKRREALLKGKDGSRRRQRWENDRLLSNPWAQPPLPSDWEVHPTHPVHHVPYYLAPLWDAQMVSKVAKKSEGHGKKGNAKVEDLAAKVPKEVRQKLKRAKAAKGLLQDLEEEVRLFVKRWNEKNIKRQHDGFGDIDSDEEEIVFVGGNGQMHDSPTRKRFQENVSKEKLVFDGLVDDHGASFGYACRLNPRSPEYCLLIVIDAGSCIRLEHTMVSVPGRLPSATLQDGKLTLGSTISNSLNMSRLLMRERFRDLCGVWYDG